MSSFCFFSLSKNNFLMSCLKVLTDLRNFVSAARLFHVFFFQVSHSEEPQVANTRIMIMSLELIVILLIRKFTNEAIGARK